MMGSVDDLFSTIPGTRYKIQDLPVERYRYSSAVDDSDHDLSELSGQWYI